MSEVTIEGFAPGRTAERRREARRSVWREQVLVEIKMRRALLARLPDIPTELRAEIEECLDQAEEAATPAPLSRHGERSSRGARIERAWGQLDTADESLLRAAPADFVIGQLPRIRRRAEKSLAPDDPRRVELDEITRRHLEGGTRSRELLAGAVVPRLCDAELSDQERARFLAAIAPCAPRHELTQQEREVLVTTFHAASCETRKKHARVRSFRNLLLWCALALALTAAGIAALGALRPGVMPLCFNPDGLVVCPTKMVALEKDAPATGQPAEGTTAAQQAKADRKARNTAQPIDVALVELMGLIGAALAAAATLRQMKGTSIPYDVPLALAVLKLPTGALTAALGFLLMRGDFVPGLSALDSPAQILAWAIVFGYSQQLFTRFVDQRGQSVLDSAGNGIARERPEPIPRAAVAAVGA
jgi:hypothetical protein